jgi:hypothetical protein
VPDALADLPVERGEAKVDGYRGLAPGLDDQATHIFKERSDWGRGWGEFTHTQLDYQEHPTLCSRGISSGFQRKAVS